VAAPARAQQTIQETVVVTATVSPETFGGIGRSLVLITREEIDRLPVASVADVLRLVSSVEVRARGPRGVQSDFAIRGASFGQALVLVNGIRLNDAQSGHHNGDIPVSLVDVERIEVLLGGGASIHGADAFGGAINVITRRAGPRYQVEFAAGDHGLVETSGAASLQGRGSTHVFSGEFDRSSGFMPARDYEVGLARYQGSLGGSRSVSFAHLDKEFGANGFYGPAPSREWTQQTLATFEQQLPLEGRWQGTLDASYRTHGDHFIYDVTRPSLSESTHRTHAVAARGRFNFALDGSTQIAIGAGGGFDTIDSSNLGDRDFSRGNALIEVRRALGKRAVVQPGLRVDTYSRFGTSWSPSLAASGWLTSSLKWRASGGHAFRVPTFTELYYHDPNHNASPELAPETAWTTDAGVDAFWGPWAASLTAFSRWEDSVIDWVRPSPDVRWRTTNIRDVTTAGIETALSQSGRAGSASIRYTWLSSEAAELDLLSKYVLDYARHSASLSAASAWKTIELGSRLEYKRRSDGRDYWVFDLRLGRAFGRLMVYGEAANLFDTSYEEVRGVVMPGRWLKAGVRVR
jgi:iron complex outermembrane receptor protein